MKPSQKLVEGLSSLFGREQMSNLVADFEDNPAHVRLVDASNVDICFLMFCSGAVNTMSPGSNFNKNYNKGFTDGAGTPEKKVEPSFTPTIDVNLQGFTVSA